jgi:hypothetical protein
MGYRLGIFLFTTASRTVLWPTQPLSNGYCDSSVQCWVTGWTIGVLGFDSRLGLGIFLFTTMSRTTLVPTQPPMQWVPGSLFLGVKRPGREADHSPPSSAKVKEWVELYLHSPIRHVTLRPRNASLNGAKIWYTDGKKFGLYAGWATNSNFSFRIVSTVAAAVWGRTVVTMRNNSTCQHSSVFTANSGFQLVFKHSTTPCTVGQLFMILVVLEDGPIRSQNDINITLSAEFLGPGRQHVFPLHTFMFACRFIVVHPCFIPWQSVAGKPLLRHDTASQTTCTFPSVHICAPM